MTDIQILHERLGSKGRYLARVKNHDGRGEMTYSVAGDHRIIVDHTGVDDRLRGLGVGQALAL